MGSTITRTISSLAPPVVLLAALILALRHWTLPAGWGELLAAAPTLACGAGALLGLRFHRMRVVLACVALGVGAWVLAHGASGFPTALLRAELPGWAPFLMPWYLGLAGLSQERGFLTWQGALQALLAAAPLGGLVWLAQPEQARWAEALREPFLPWGLAEGSAVPHAALALYAAAGALLLGRVIWRRGALDGGFLGALAGSLLGLLARGEAQQAAHMATAGVVLIVAVVQDSYSMAYLDELTRLPGRRALNEQLMRLGSRYTIAMLDVDHFKKFNDKYGHDVGDQVLRMVASQLEGVGGGGKAFRYGGEEFTIVFPWRSAPKVMAQLEEVRTRVEQARLTLRAPDRPSKKPKNPPKKRANAPQVSVTISIGLAERGGDLTTPEQVIEAADKALYRAKKKGRNCVST